MELYTSCHTKPHQVQSEYSTCICCCRQTQPSVVSPPKSLWSQTHSTSVNPLMLGWLSQSNHQSKGEKSSKHIFCRKRLLQLCPKPRKELCIHARNDVLWTPCNWTISHISIHKLLGSPSPSHRYKPSNLSPPIDVNPNSIVPSLTPQKLTMKSMDIESHL